MPRIRTFITVLAASLILVSCTALKREPQGAQVIDLKHVKGEAGMCLASCVDMVLSYYGFNLYYGGPKEPALSANLLSMDSLIEALGSTDPNDPNTLHSFVVQADESFLQEQLVRKRPVIIIINCDRTYHSVVIAGMTADHREYFIHDPAQSKACWISRGKLLGLWKSTGNTAMLIGIAPAGT